MMLYTPLKAEKPPSTGTTIPLTKAEAGLQSQIRVPPNSSGFPKRPAGVCSMIVCPLFDRLPSSSSNKSLLLPYKEAWRYGVDPEVRAVAARELDGEPAGEVVDGGLGSRVADHVGQGFGSGHGRDVHDAPIWLLGTLDHGSPENLAGKQGSQEVEVHHLPQGFLRQLENSHAIGESGPGHVPASGVYEDVYPAPPLEQGVSGVLELAGIEHVGRKDE